MRLMMKGLQRWKICLSQIGISSMTRLCHFEGHCLELSPNGCGIGWHMQRDLRTGINVRVANSRRMICGWSHPWLATVYPMSTMIGRLKKFALTTRQTNLDIDLADPDDSPLDSNNDTNLCPVEAKANDCPTLYCSTSFPTVESAPQSLVSFSLSPPGSPNGETKRVRVMQMT